MPTLPYGPITLVPDWVCEVLSPTTRRHNLLIKKPYYARIDVPWHWLVDLDARTVTVLKLVGGAWSEIGTFGDETDARLPQPQRVLGVHVRLFFPSVGRILEFEALSARSTTTTSPNPSRKPRIILSRRPHPRRRSRDLRRSIGTQPGEPLPS
jgi:hypothetical protein